MRHNYTVRRSNLVDYYDTEYIFLSDQPFVSRIIDHPRKLVLINRCADSRRAEPVEMFNPDYNPFL